jgi:hypothetical protein
MTTTHAHQLTDQNEGTARPCRHCGSALCSQCALARIPAYVPGEEIFTGYPSFSPYSTDRVGRAVGDRGARFVVPIPYPQVLASQQVNSHPAEGAEP